MTNAPARVNPKLPPRMAVGGFAADMEVAWVDRSFWILPRMTALNLFASALLVPWFWPRMPDPARAGWLVAMLLFIGARLLVIGRLKAWRADPRRSAQGSYRLWFVLALVSGVYWGSTAWLLFRHGNAHGQLLLGFVMYGLCVLNSYHVTARYPAFEANFVCSMVPLALCIATPLTVSNVTIAASVLVIVGGTGFLSRYYLMNFRRLGENMMRQLHQEKAAADDARRAADRARHEAEVANRARTQFFAAASHDLRQPLHAMGLLAEALSQRSQDQALAPLVASLHGSVDALEELFSELLDITTIESGAVAVSPEHFEVGEVFRRLRLHFEPVAFDKGLSLRFRGARQLLHADPVLVERILRNLLSNAIRYTVDGGVVVGCRRRGARVQLQVWDTGVGIPEDERDRVFEAYYQVTGGQATGAQDRKGLGLGLSIAQRLSGLMGASLTLRSLPGRGSVFSFELPAGDAARSLGRGKATALAAA